MKEKKAKAVTKTQTAPKLTKTRASKPEKPAKQEIREEIKSVKYTFADKELIDLGKELAAKNTDLDSINEEAKSVAKSYKSKEAEIQGAIGSLTEKIKSGFELRPMKCRVVFRVKEGKKDYFRVDTGELSLTESMTNADLQMELNMDMKRAEASMKQESDQKPKDLDKKQLASGEGIVQVPLPSDSAAPINLELWSDSEGNSGKLTVYKESGLWFCSVNANVGERMFMTSPKKMRGYKERFDSISGAIKDLMKWLREEMPDAAAGFDAGMAKVLDQEKGKVE